MRTFVTMLVLASALLSMSPRAHAFDAASFFANANRWTH